MRSRRALWIIGIVFSFIIISVVGVFVQDYSRHNRLRSSVVDVKYLLDSTLPDTGSVKSSCGSFEAKLGRTQKACDIVFSSTHKVESENDVRRIVSSFRDKLRASSGMTDSDWSKDTKVTSWDNIAYFDNQNSKTTNRVCTASYQYEAPRNVLHLSYACGDSSWLTRLMDAVGLYR